MLLVSCAQPGSYPYDIYNAGGREKKIGVGLTDGFASVDGKWPNNVRRKLQREATFPLHLIELALETALESAQVSAERDRVHILNVLFGVSCRIERLNAPPPKVSHPSFAELNGVVSARFAASAVHVALAAYRAKPFLSEMRNGQMHTLVKDFYNHNQMTETSAAQLAEAMPRNLSVLRLDMNKLGDVFLGAVDFTRLDTLTQLILPNNCISNAGLAHITNAMSSLGGQRLGKLSKLNLAGNLIETDAMMRLFEVVVEREELEGGISVKGNPCKDFAMLAVETRQLDLDANRYLEAEAAKREEEAAAERIRKRARGEKVEVRR